jgi:uncharacterized protein (TIGR02391 family)
LRKEHPFKAAQPTFSEAHMEAIAKIMSSCLSTSEIGRYLGASRIPDPEPTITKWVRIYNAIARFQNEYQVGNHIIIFLSKSLDPALYIQKQEAYEGTLSELNKVLSFCGFNVGKDGKVRTLTSKSTTIDEAKAREAHLRNKLQQRNAHSQVFKFCNSELLQNNYFHAVFEAVKSVSYRIREISGLDGDGQSLAELAFGSQKGSVPIVKINSYDNGTKIGEQFGFLNLIKGLYGSFRNPLAHEAKIEWEMSEDDALDVMSLISLIHRRLDKSFKI